MQKEFCRNHLSLLEVTLNLTVKIKERFFFFSVVIGQESAQS